MRLRTLTSRCLRIHLQSDIHLDAITVDEHTRPIATLSKNTDRGTAPPSFIKRRCFARTLIFRCEPLLELDAHLAQKVIDGGTRIENDR